MTLGHRAWFSGAALALASCGERREPPRWIDLARAFAPTPLIEIVGAAEDAAGPRESVNVRPGERGVTLDHRIAVDAWVDEGDGIWSAAWPGGAFDLGAPAQLALVADARSFTGGAGPELAPGELARAGARLRVRTSDEPPGAATLRLWLPGTYTVDGRTCVSLGSTFGPGLVLWAGVPERVRVATPPESRFVAWACAPAGAARSMLRVRVDGRERLACGLEGGADAVEVSVALPSTGARAAELELVFEGEGSAVLFAPFVAPLEIGSPADRPWPESRRDVVLFIADTLRADAMAVCGGTTGLMPRLDAVAERSVVFTDARAAASWTLPSISSMLTGLYPAEHGALDVGRRLPEALDTLPELFARAGYRTGAATDGVFFSWEYGLAQGFESFTRTRYDEWSLDATLAAVREFLARDDGRPIFLVVHSFRVHTPYRTGRAEELVAWKSFLEEARAAATVDGRVQPERRTEVLLALRDPFRALYDEGVRGLDERVGELLVLLERAGVLPEGLFAFTADHGEAFGEHGEFLHGGELWDEKMRVPLLLHGAGLPSLRVPADVSLVDLGVTLAEVAGVPEALGHGRSLLAADERPVYAFNVDGEKIQATVWARGRKLFLELEDVTGSDAHLTRAFDLASDPGEQRDVAGTAEWTHELLHRHGRAAPTLEAGDVRVLRELGYVGD